MSYELTIDPPLPKLEEFSATELIVGEVALVVSKNYAVASETKPEFAVRCSNGDVAFIGRVSYTSAANVTVRRPRKGETFNIAVKG